MKYSDFNLIPNPSGQGYVQSGRIGKAVFLNLDGVDDFGALGDLDVLNPTDDDDFCQMVVFNRADVSSRYYGITRNNTDLATMQYGLVNGTDTGTSLSVVLEGTATAITADMNTELLYVLYGRASDELFAIVDGTETLSVADTTLLTERANTQLSSISSVADGTTKTGYAKGLQGDIAFWKGANGTLDKDKLVDLVKKGMAYKYNL
jgi:hypothetical protein